MAAARCSETQVLAVPGTPSSSSARSVASVATATSISRRGPMYFGVMAVAVAAAGRSPRPAATAASPAGGAGRRRRRARPARRRRATRRAAAAPMRADVDLGQPLWAHVVRVWLGHDISWVSSVWSVVSPVISAVMSWRYASRPASSPGRQGCVVAGSRPASARPAPGPPGRTVPAAGPRPGGTAGTGRRPARRGGRARDAAHRGLPQRVGPGRRAGDEQRSPRRADTLRQRGDRPLGQLLAVQDRIEGRRCGTVPRAWSVPSASRVAAAQLGVALDRGGPGESTMDGAGPVVRRPAGPRTPTAGPARSTAAPGRAPPRATRPVRRFRTVASRRCRPGASTCRTRPVA